MTRGLVADVLAAAASRLGGDATGVLARLGGSLGDGARAASRDLASLDDRERKQRRAELAALARVPLATSLRGVHPTWIEAGLVDLPARARTALAGESVEPIDVWLARWAAAALPPMPRAGVDALDERDRQLTALLAREPAQLVAWLTSIALDQLAFALGAVPAAAAARLPPMLAAAVARVARPPRLNALGPQRAALARSRGAVLDDESALIAIAGRALAPHFSAHPLARLQLTRRLPYAIGIVVERELRLHASVALDQVPAWLALIAN